MKYSRHQALKTEPAQRLHGRNRKDGEDFLPAPSLGALSLGPQQAWRVPVGQARGQGSDKGTLPIQRMVSTQSPHPPRPRLSGSAPRW